MTAARDPRDIIADALCLWRDRKDCACRDKHLPDANRITDALRAAGLLTEPGGEGTIYAVIKTVPGREFEILADLCTDVHEVRQWVAALHADPDRDPLATYTAYRLVEVTNG